MMYRESPTTRRRLKLRLEVTLLVARDGRSLTKLGRLPPLRSSRSWHAASPSEPQGCSLEVPSRSRFTDSQVKEE